MAEFVSLEVSDQVATLLLQRPPMNALNRQMQTEIREAAQEIATRRDIGAVVLYGGPKVFAAGADIKEMSDMSYQDMLLASADLQDAFTSVARIPQPTLAAVTGYALGGGCELALCCDMRVAGESAKLGQPEILLGIIPGAGGTQRLPRLVGPSRAKDLIFTGRHVDAQEAMEIGLVNAVVPDDETYDSALAIAKRLAKGPALALRAAKESVDRGLDTDLATGLDIERVRFAGLFATDDQKIGMQAFVEKRPAEFTGN
ncbi:MAG: enoyl-CoA hydratase-related protein [Candidatus Nanopelagicales bacterium]|jgi:enoyl-CoA hydratase/carnithine racemase|nr:enoyl-CoA hydratase/isomerase family protein [Candidatus Nanopelagicales bacterium]MCF8538556.1 enoyl-CoA hydratase/isomerase family protein [Candidatus Nanopelagicales bacterium]MCF8542108.1 enoyl-CoA hydratase/isomerase family protein [Candidatus Nanopelagicales bacterium]MCF8556774.1 enoyl-CoA hydratase/isomerase family protein [Candidatus Nanopelagicales bacterium]